MENRVFIAEAEDAGKRLDVFLAGETEFTRSYIKQLVDKARITVNECEVKCGRLLKNGDAISVNIPEADGTIPAEDIPLDILYEDEDLAVINKSQGLTVHPAAGNYTGTLVNALMFHLNSLSTINGVIRPGIVHRLDKDTSGVMVVAKNDAAHLELSRQIERREVKKLYYAVLEGNLPKDEDTVVTRIGRSPRERKLMAVTTDGREAITRYKVIERFSANCLAQFDILTGRTHQIRVHSKFLGHPVVGDSAYGFKKQRFALNGQLLHSHTLSFVHPRTKQELTFSAPLPDYFIRVLNVLRSENKGGI